MAGNANYLSFSDTIESSTAAIPDNALFAGRIIAIDHYMGFPLVKDSGVELNEQYRVLHPIIRIFGSTLAGQKCCMHVHGVFPYIYIDVKDPLKVLERGKTYLRDLETYLEEYLNRRKKFMKSQGRIDESNPDNSDSDGGFSDDSTSSDDESNPSSQRTKYIRLVEFVRGINFYGFHKTPSDVDGQVRYSDETQKFLYERIVKNHNSLCGTSGSPCDCFPQSSARTVFGASGSRLTAVDSPIQPDDRKGKEKVTHEVVDESGRNSHLFVRIVLYDPRMVRVVASKLRDELHASLIGKTSVNPPYTVFEAHISYIQQFFTDYNVSGMGIIRFSDVRFRSPLPYSSYSIRRIMGSEVISSNRLRIPSVALQHLSHHSRAISSFLQQENEDQVLNEELSESFRSSFEVSNGSLNMNRSLEASSLLEDEMADVSTRYWNERTVPDKLRWNLEIFSISPYLSSPNAGVNLTSRGALNGTNSDSSSVAAKTTDTGIRSSTNPASLLDVGIPATFSNMNMIKPLSEHIQSSSGPRQHRSFGIQPSGRIKAPITTSASPTSAVQIAAVPYSSNSPSRISSSSPLPSSSGREAGVKKDAVSGSAPESDEHLPSALRYHNVGILRPLHRKGVAYVTPSASVSPSPLFIPKLPPKVCESGAQIHEENQRGSIPISCSISKSSSCELEVDVWAADILNAGERVRVSQALQSVHEAERSVILEASLPPSFTSNVSNETTSSSDSLSDQRTPLPQGEGQSGGLPSINAAGAGGSGPLISPGLCNSVSNTASKAETSFVSNTNSSVAGQRLLKQVARSMNGVPSLLDWWHQEIASASNEGRALPKPPDIPAYHNSLVSEQLASAARTERLLTLIDYGLNLPPPTERYLCPLHQHGDDSKNTIHPSPFHQSFPIAALLMHLSGQSASLLPSVAKCSVCTENQSKFRLYRPVHQSAASMVLKWGRFVVARHIEKAFCVTTGGKGGYPFIYHPSFQNPATAYPTSVGTGKASFLYDGQQDPNVMIAQTMPALAYADLKGSGYQEGILDKSYFRAEVTFGAAERLHKVVDTLHEGLLHAMRTLLLICSSFPTLSAFNSSGSNAESGSLISGSITSSSTRLRLLNIRKSQRIRAEVSMASAALYSIATYQRNRSGKWDWDSHAIQRVLLSLQKEFKERSFHGGEKDDESGRGIRSVRRLKYVDDWLFSHIEGSESDSNYDADENNMNRDIIDRLDGGTLPSVGHARIAQLLRVVGRDAHEYLSQLASPSISLAQTNPIPKLQQELDGDTNMKSEFGNASNIDRPDIPLAFQSKPTDMYLQASAPSVPVHLLWTRKFMYMRPGELTPTVEEGAILRSAPLAVPNSNNSLVPSPSRAPKRPVDAPTAAAGDIPLDEVNKRPRLGAPPLPPPFPFQSQKQSRQVPTHPKTEPENLPSSDLNEPSSEVNPIASEQIVLESENSKIIPGTFPVQFTPTRGASLASNHSTPMSNRSWRSFGSDRSSVLSGGENSGNIILSDSDLSSESETSSSLDTSTSAPGSNMNSDDDMNENKRTMDEEDSPQELVSENKMSANSTSLTHNLPLQRSNRVSLVLNSTKNTLERLKRGMKSLRSPTSGSEFAARSVEKELLFRPQRSVGEVDEMNTTGFSLAARTETLYARQRALKDRQKLSKKKIKKIRSKDSILDMTDENAIVNHEASLASLLSDDEDDNARHNESASTNLPLNDGFISTDSEADASNGLVSGLLFSGASARRSRLLASRDAEFLSSPPVHPGRPTLISTPSSVGSNNNNRILGDLIDDSFTSMDTPNHLPSSAVVSSPLKGILLDRESRAYGTPRAPLSVSFSLQSPSARFASLTASDDKVTHVEQVEELETAVDLPLDEKKSNFASRPLAQSLSLDSDSSAVLPDLDDQIPDVDIDEHAIVAEDGLEVADKAENSDKEEEGNMLHSCMSIDLDPESSHSDGPPSAVPHLEEAARVVDCDVCCGSLKLPDFRWLKLHPRVSNLLQMPSPCSRLFVPSATDIAEGSTDKPLKNERPKLLMVCPWEPPSYYSVLDSLEQYGLSLVVDSVPHLTVDIDPILLPSGTRITVGEEGTTSSNPHYTSHVHKGGSTASFGLRQRQVFFESQLNGRSHIFPLISPALLPPFETRIFVNLFLMRTAALLGWFGLDVSDARANRSRGSVTLWEEFSAFSDEIQADFLQDFTGLPHNSLPAIDLSTRTNTIGRSDIELLEDSSFRVNRRGRARLRERRSSNVRKFMYVNGMAFTLIDKGSQKVYVPVSLATGFMRRLRANYGLLATNKAICVSAPLMPSINESLFPSDFLFISYISAYHRFVALLGDCSPSSHRHMVSSYHKCNVCRNRFSHHGRFDGNEFKVDSRSDSNSDSETDSIDSPGDEGEPSVEKSDADKDSDFSKEDHLGNGEEELREGIVRVQYELASLLLGRKGTGGAGRLSSALGATYGSGVGILSIPEDPWWALKSARFDRVFSAPRGRGGDGVDVALQESGVLLNRDFRLLKNMRSARLRFSRFLGPSTYMQAFLDNMQARAQAHMIENNEFFSPNGSKMPLDAPKREHDLGVVPPSPSNMSIMSSFSLSNSALSLSHHALSHISRSASAEVAKKNNKSKSRIVPLLRNNQPAFLGQSLLVPSPTLPDVAMGQSHGHIHSMSVLSSNGSETQFSAQLAHFAPAITTDFSSGFSGDMHSGVQPPFLKSNTAFTAPHAMVDVTPCWAHVRISELGQPTYSDLSESQRMKCAQAGHVCWTPGDPAFSLSNSRNEAVSPVSLIDSVARSSRLTQDSEVVEVLSQPSIISLDYSIISSSLSPESSPHSAHRESKKDENISSNIPGHEESKLLCVRHSWTPMIRFPTYREVERWLGQESAAEVAVNPMENAKESGMDLLNMAHLMKSLDESVVETGAIGVVNSLVEDADESNGGDNISVIISSISAPDLISSSNCQSPPISLTDPLYETETSVILFDLDDNSYKGVHRGDQLLDQKSEAVSTDRFHDYRPLHHRNAYRNEHRNMSMISTGTGNTSFHASPLTGTLLAREICEKEEEVYHVAARRSPSAYTMLHSRRRKQFNGGGVFDYMGKTTPAREEFASTNQMNRGKLPRVKNLLMNQLSNVSDGGKIDNSVEKTFLNSISTDKSENSLKNEEKTTRKAENTTPKKAVVATHQDLSILSVEVFSPSLGRLSNPQTDPVLALAWSVQLESLVERERQLSAQEGRPFQFQRTLISGVILVDPTYSGHSSGSAESSSTHKRNTTSLECDNLGVLGTGELLGSLCCPRPPAPPHCLTSVAPSEAALFHQLLLLLRSFDPDVLVGHEVQNNSWGYLVERGLCLHPPLDLLRLGSRTPTERICRRNRMDVHDSLKNCGIFMRGRLILNAWRRYEAEDLKLMSFSQSYVAWTVLRRRIPEFSHGTLTEWFRTHSAGVHFNSKTSSERQITSYPACLSRVLAYFVNRSETTLTLFDHLDVLGRGSELSRLLGVDFYSVLFRGSQFRVEAILGRVAKPHSYLMPSPSKRQVDHQHALMAAPLIYESKSGIYTHPVIVLDFQSLYPSVMIANNICYTTAVGSLAGASDSLQQGLGVFKDYKAPVGVLAASTRPHDIAKGYSYHHHSVGAEMARGRIWDAVLAIAKIDKEINRLLDTLYPREFSNDSTNSVLNSGTNRTPELAGTLGTLANSGPSLFASSSVRKVDEDGGDTLPELFSRSREFLKLFRSRGGGGDRDVDDTGSNTVPKLKINEIKQHPNHQSIILSPNEYLFVPACVRVGILPTMLNEILNTRVMMKKAMAVSSNPSLRRLYNNRQLALKLILAVTYGYTSSGATGRMPCSPIADAIVSTGRAHLESLLELISSHKKWKASVYYGDTDSIFVGLPGRSVEAAFQVGEEIVAAARQRFANPLLLKLEKVYYPCALVTKKRYVGVSFEPTKQYVSLAEQTPAERARNEPQLVGQIGSKNWFKTRVERSTKINPSGTGTPSDSTMKVSSTAAKKSKEILEKPKVTSGPPFRATLDVKGLEVIRSDSCPFVSLGLRGAMETFFSTLSVSLLRDYVVRLIQRAEAGRLPISVFVFRKNFRGSYRGSMNPTAAVAALLSTDARAKPLVNDKIPFLITIPNGMSTNGRGNISTAAISSATMATDSPALLAQAAVHVLAYASMPPGTRPPIDVPYYVAKLLLPSMQRVFELVGLNVSLFHHYMPRSNVQYSLNAMAAAVLNFKSADSMNFNKQENRERTSVPVFGFRSHPTSSSSSSHASGAQMKSGIIYDPWKVFPEMVDLNSTFSSNLDGPVEVLDLEEGQSDLKSTQHVSTSSSNITERASLPNPFRESVLAHPDRDKVIENDSSSFEVSDLSSARISGKEHRQRQFAFRGIQDGLSFSRSKDPFEKVNSHIPLSAQLAAIGVTPVVDSSRPPSHQLNNSNPLKGFLHLNRGAISYKNKADKETDASLPKKGRKALNLQYEDSNQIALNQSVLRSRSCIICGATGPTTSASLIDPLICRECGIESRKTHDIILRRLFVADRALNEVNTACFECIGSVCGHLVDIECVKSCVATECDIFYERRKLYEQSTYLHKLADYMRIQV